MRTSVVIETTEAETLLATSAMEPSVKLAELPSEVKLLAKVMGVSPRKKSRREKVRLAPERTRARITRARVRVWKSKCLLAFGVFWTDFSDFLGFSGSTASEFSLTSLVFGVSSIMIGIVPPSYVVYTLKIGLLKAKTMTAIRMRLKAVGGRTSL